jgi:nucleoside recognition membrane protein YjiH
MNENPDVPAGNRNIWVRGLFMLLMALVLHVSGTVMFVISIVQFAIMLMNGTPNERLVSFGRSLGRYFRQIVNFMTFATEEMPFPFSNWPAGNGEGL